MLSNEKQKVLEHLKVVTDEKQDAVLQIQQKMKDLQALKSRMEAGEKESKKLQVQLKDFREKVEAKDVLIGRCQKKITSQQAKLTEWERGRRLKKEKVLEDTSGEISRLIEALKALERENLKLKEGVSSQRSVAMRGSATMEGYDDNKENLQSTGNSGTAGLKNDTCIPAEMKSLRTLVKQYEFKLETMRKDYQHLSLAKATETRSRIQLEKQLQQIAEQKQKLLQKNTKLERSCGHYLEQQQVQKNRRLMSPSLSKPEYPLSLTSTSSPVSTTYKEIDAHREGKRVVAEGIQTDKVISFDALGMEPDTQHQCSTSSTLVVLKEDTTVAKAPTSIPTVEARPECVQQ